MIFGVKDVTCVPSPDLSIELDRFKWMQQSRYVDPEQAEAILLKQQAIMDELNRRAAGGAIHSREAAAGHRALKLCREEIAVPDNLEDQIRGLLLILAALCDAEGLSFGELAQEGAEIGRVRAQTPSTPEGTRPTTVSAVPPGMGGP